MAKSANKTVTKVEPEAPTGAEEKEVKSVPKTRKVVFYAPGRKLTEDDKLPQQAAVIVDVVHNIGKEVTREELSKALEGQLKTRQPVERIVGYYQSKLQSMGLVTVEKREIPIAA